MHERGELFHFETEEGRHGFLGHMYTGPEERREERTGELVREMEKRKENEEKDRESQGSRSRKGKQNLCVILTRGVKNERELGTFTKY